tara:strand:- start:999 stop:1214 length:216 start_codon:yes stop_codon:yes gene_type:complete
MDNSIEIEATYTAFCSTPVDLPEGRTVDDIEDHYVKWDTFHYAIDGVWYESELDLPETYIKRPDSYAILTN